VTSLREYFKGTISVLGDEQLLTLCLQNVALISLHYLKIKFSVNIYFYAIGKYGAVTHIYTHKDVIRGDSFSANDT